MSVKEAIFHNGSCSGKRLGLLISNERRKVKMLRKFGVVFAVVALLCLVQASPGFSVTFTTYNMDDGTWQEIYAGGGPGQPGNTLTAIDGIADSDSWQLTDGKLVNVSVISTGGGSNPYKVYATDYTGKLTATGYGGPNINNLPVHFTVTALIYDSGTYGWGNVVGGDGFFNFSGQLARTGFSGTYPNYTGHYGDITQVKLNVVPLPGALLLLGAGLVRLAAYGRRRRNEV